MTVRSEAARLTTAHRAAQSRRAATIAALVAAYYRTRVEVSNPETVARWVELMLPRVLDGHRQSATLASTYANTVRRLEVPNAPSFNYEPVTPLVREQIERSLQTTGLYEPSRKIARIQERDLEPQQERALVREVERRAERAAAGAVVRHIQNGGRATIYENQQRDRVALGYLRVLHPVDPCYFCAMLASRGPVFSEGSFDFSDPRFTGEGNVKVHDSCRCSLKVLYRDDDATLERAEEMQDLWNRWGAGGGGHRAVLRFRRGYDHWRKTGEFLDWEQVDAASGRWSLRSVLEDE